MRNRNLVPAIVVGVVLVGGAALADILLKDEGNRVGPVNGINCVGEGLTCTREGSTAKLTFTPPQSTGGVTGTGSAGKVAVWSNSASLFAPSYFTWHETNRMLMLGSTDLTTDKFGLTLDVTNTGSGRVARFDRSQIVTTSGSPLLGIGAKTKNYYGGAWYGLGFGYAFNNSGDKQPVEIGSRQLSGTDYTAGDFYVATRATTDNANPTVRMIVGTSTSITGGLGVSGTISTESGIQFPDGTVQTTAAAGGGGGLTNWTEREDGSLEGSLTPSRLIMRSLNGQRFSLTVSNSGALLIEGYYDSILDGLLAYWTLDGSAEDSVNGYDGTESAITYAEEVGKIKGGALFNGSSSHIDFGNSIPLDSNSWSMAVWLYPTNFTGTKRILSYYNNGPTLYTSSGSGVLQIVHGGSVDFQCSANLTLNTWQHIVVTRSNNTITCYKNGAQTARSTTFNVTFTADSSVRLGNSTGWSNERFGGNADEVGLWSRPLSAAEVTTLYNEGSGLSYPFRP